MGLYDNRNWIKLYMKMIVLLIVKSTTLDVFKRPGSSIEFPNPKTMPLIINPSCL